MNKKVLIIASETNFSYSNPNSAVANYLNTLTESLEKEAYIIETFPTKEKTQIITTAINSKTSLKKKIKGWGKYLFPRLYVTLILKRKKKKLNLVPSKIIAKNFKPDLIIEFLSVGSNIGVKLKQHYNIPLLIIFDSPLKEQFCEMHKSSPFNAEKKINQNEKKSIEGADSIICYSESVKNYLQNKYKTNAKIYTQPCIVWKEKIVPDKEKEQLIGFIGSFLVWHRVDLLVNAFEYIAAEFPRAKLVLIGYGQEWKKINQLVSECKFKDRIVLTGYVSENELTEWKQKMLIGVMPGSNWYGSPLKLFEYAQDSIAIIAPKTPVVLDLFSKDEVLFIDEKNQENSLIENIRLLLTNDNLRNKLITNATIKMTGIYSKSQQLDIFNQIIENTIYSETSK